MAEVSIDMELFRRYVRLMGPVANRLAFWPCFEQNPGAGEDLEDWTANAYHITNIAAYDDVPYIRGSQLAHRFNGVDEYWEHADHDAFSMGADGTAGNEPCMTMGLWLCPRLDNTEISLIGKWDDVTPETEYLLSLSAVNSYPRFEIWDNTTPAYIGREYQTALPLDEWAFLVATYGAAGMASIDVYLNGVAVDDADYNNAVYDYMENTDSPFQVGCDDGGGAGATPENFFQGDLWGPFILTDYQLPAANVLEMYRVGRRLLEI